LAIALRATPFDVEGAFWGDKEDRTTFDVMIEEFGTRHS
jgi:hypothetical protein